jgi:hypothetical protein
MAVNWGHTPREALVVLASFDTEMLSIRTSPSFAFRSLPALSSQAIVQQDILTRTNDIERSRLPTPIRSQQTQHCILSDPQSDIIQDLIVPEALLHM